MTNRIEFIPSARIFTASSNDSRIIIDLFPSGDVHEATTTPTGNGWIATNLNHEGSVVYARNAAIPLFVADDQAKVFINDVDMTDKILSLHHAIELLEQTRERLRAMGEEMEQEWRDYKIDPDIFDDQRIELAWEFVNIKREIIAHKRKLSSILDGIIAQ